MFELRHEFEVDAPAAVVWEVITDLDRYGDWNPFVVEARSTLKPGDVIDMKVKLVGPPQKQQEVMLSFDEGRGFAYRMKPFPLGALSSRRSHEITPLDDGRCRYRSHFELRGWMMPLVRGLFGAAMTRGFDGMSAGIRDEAQRRAAKAA